MSEDDADWVSENFNGDWELFVDPTAIKNEIDDLRKQVKECQATALRWMIMLFKERAARLKSK